MERDQQVDRSSKSCSLHDQSATPSSPRTLLFVCASPVMAGAEHNLVRLIPRLNAAEFQSIVVCPDQGELAEVCQQSGIPVEVLPRPRFYSTSIRIGSTARVPNPIACAWDSVIVGFHARSLSRYVSRLRPNLIVTKGMLAHLYGSLAARSCGVPCLWHVEDWVSERWFGLFRRLFARLAQALPTHIVGCADPIARQLPPTIQDKVSIIYNGIDADSYRSDGDGIDLRQQLGISIDALVIGNIARMIPWKGQRHLLEAFARIAPKYPSARLLFIGSALFERDTFLEELRRRAEQLGLSDRVLFLGHRRDVRNLLKVIDVFAYTALEKDTGPLSVLEAMASSLPIVGYDIPGVRMFVSQDSEGLLVPVGEIDALACTLATVLDDAALRQRLGQGALQRVESALTFDRHVQQFESLFRKLISAHSSTTARHLCVKA